MQFARFHTEETVYGVQGANACNKKSDKHYHRENGNYNSRFSQHDKPGLIFEADFQSVPDDDACEYGRCKPDPQVSAYERLAYE